MSGGSPAFDAGQTKNVSTRGAVATVELTRDEVAAQSVDRATVERHGAATAAAVEQAVTGPRGSRWRTKYQTAAVLADLSAAICAMVAAFGVRFGGVPGRSEPIPVVLLVLFPFAWIAVAGLSRAYEVRILGAGAIEYERLGKAFLQLTAAITFAAYASHSNLPRGLVLLALPATLALSAAFRFVLRKFVHRRRRAGSALIPVLAVGAADAIAAFSDTLARNAHNGLYVGAACVVADEFDASVAGATSELDERAIPTSGDLDSIREAVRETGVSTVAVVDNRISGDRLRWISWQLEGTDTDLVVLPTLTEVAGRRLSIMQVGELPLLYVAEPEFRGLRRLIKSGFDRLSALILLALFSPFMIAIAVAVRTTSRGPALFFQTRVGKNGKPFRMVKFRSMVDDAEARLEHLKAFNEVDGGMLFKIKSDPRVTRVGKVLRRFSLDEVPQLFNVVTGSMSLVGPRPPLPAEVAQYGGDVRRRLLVKPGMTGLWQISGRSQLTWEESIRLDLRYVENWSLTLDAIVLLRTFSAVLRQRGAY